MYHFCQNEYDIIPFSIPRWMISTDLTIHVGTFLMPTLIYSLLVLILRFTSEKKEHKAWVNFLIAIGIPIGAYLFIQVISPLRFSFGSRFREHLFLILIITSTITFLFFLVRGLYIIVTKKGTAWRKYQLVWKIPIALLFPVIGLLLNNGHLFSDYNSFSSNVFGDFSDSWFYILAVTNGLLVCLPNLDKRLYRLSLFIFRSVTFSFTFYFFLVFLPFLPISLIAIICIGTGFLMLSPLLLFVIHVFELSKDFSYLRSTYSKKILSGVSVLSFLVIPAFITVNFLNDKKTLDETLSYLYSPDYSKNYKIDKASLNETLSVIKSHKDGRNSRDGVFGDRQPYLSSYFNWLVLDNLTLSDSKIQTIEQVFFDETSFKIRSENLEPDPVIISHIETESTYDKTQNAWKSWINLELTNESTTNRFSEYITTIDLPDGAWISDYYLYVGDKKEPGILAEKRSAMWIYSQIRNRNRDPGILYYLTGNKVAFRVFPFTKNEVRKTGMEFIHKEPVKLTIDNHVIELGNEEETVYETIETDHCIYVSALQKQDLKSVNRQPYFHFLVDISRSKENNISEFTERIEQKLATHKNLAANSKISFINSYVNTTNSGTNWQDDYKNQVFEGGFYLERAIKSTLINSYQEISNSYPVIVVVTDSIEQAIIEKDFKDLKFAFPESDLFYDLDQYGNLNEHSFIQNPIKKLPETKRECRFCENVLEYKLPDNSVRYLPDNNQPSIVLINDLFRMKEEDIKEKNWSTALAMQSQWNSQIIHPENSNKEWLRMVRQSFKSKIMTPVTSFLVVENDAQKAMLKKKQEQVLSGNSSLDLSEDVRRMSEPSFILLTVLLGLFLWFREKR